MKCIKDIPLDKIKSGLKFVIINEKNDLKDFKHKDILEVLFVRAGLSDLANYIIFKDLTTDLNFDLLVHPKSKLETIVNHIFYDDSIQ
jgi:hypothetical protein